MIEKGRHRWGPEYGPCLYITRPSTGIHLGLCAYSMRSYAAVDKTKIVRVVAVEIGLWWQMVLAWEWPE